MPGQQEPCSDRPIPTITRFSLSHPGLAPHQQNGSKEIPADDFIYLFSWEQVQSPSSSKHLNI